MNKFSNLVSLLSTITDEKTMSDFLKNILTPKEIKEIPNRLEIIRQLKNNVPQQKIAKKLRVGIATVTRGSKIVKEEKLPDFIWQNLRARG